MIAVILFISALAWANEQKSVEQDSCKVVLDACKAAGFVKGGYKEKKGFFKDCMWPVLKGQSVPGVTVDSSVAQACQAKREKKKAARAAH